jgi:hypothetical protein
VEGCMQSVQHEVKANSGASLRDAVDRANEPLERLCRPTWASRCEPPLAPPGRPALERTPTLCAGVSVPLSGLFGHCC